MPVYIVLSFFDARLGPTIFLEHPKISNQKINDYIVSIFDINYEQLFFEVKNEIGYFLNLRIELESPLARGGIENALLSIILTDVNSIYKWKAIFDYLKEKITILHNNYNFFHFKNQTTNEAQKIKEDLTLLFAKVLNDYKEFEESNAYSQLFVGGIEKVGKSSIINRLKKGRFSPNVRPTLGTHVLNAAIENLKFKIFDVGGQKALRKTWFLQCLQPEGIIYVIDAIQDSNRSIQFIEEYKRVIQHYILSKPKGYAHKIPILILMNKIDLVDPSKHDELIRKVIQNYSLRSISNPINFFLVSAKSGHDIYESFKWLIVQKLIN